MSSLRAQRNCRTIRAMMSSDRDRFSFGRAAVVLAALSSFLFAFVLSAAPGLHEHLHSDAAHPQHECAIAIVESGLETADTPLSLPAPEAAKLFSKVPTLHPVWVPAPFLSACAFEHAPPVLS
jgi:hypothetical protein